MKPLNEISKVSVIIAVYNHFHWLSLVLDALRQQSEPDFEVVIADDGSDADTVENISLYQKIHPDLKIIHSWQPDNGWQKNKCLNKAVRAASGDFLIFIDGDCVPHPRFVEDHLRLRCRGRVFGGRRVEMSESVSMFVESWKSLPRNYFPKLRSRILRDATKSSLTNTIHQFLRTFRFPFVNGKPLILKHNYFWGCNFSIYRDDLEKVNGFDERYVDPGTGEDIDLGVRLENAGLICVKSSHYALMFHRHHNRLDFSSSNNARLFKEAQVNNITFVENGLKPIGEHKSI